MKEEEILYNIFKRRKVVRTPFLSHTHTHIQTHTYFGRNKEFLLFLFKKPLFWEFSIPKGDSTSFSFVWLDCVTVCQQLKQTDVHKNKRENYVTKWSRSTFFSVSSLVCFFPFCYDFVKCLSFDFVLPIFSYFVSNFCLLLSIFGHISSPPLFSVPFNVELDVFRWRG